MGRHLPQNLNQPLALRNEIRNEGGLVATPFTGSVAIAVLLWNLAGDRVGPTDFMTELNSATEGTTVTIFKAGVYEATLRLEQAASQDTFYGISQDGVDAVRLTTPTFANAGMLDVQHSISAAATVRMLPITTDFVVRPEQEGTGSVIRFHAAIAGDAAPAGDLVAAGCYYTIRRINQAHE